MKRILAQKIVYKGDEYPLSIVEIADDGKSLAIFPFKEEIANTIYYNGRVIVKETSEGVTLEYA